MIPILCLLFAVVSVLLYKGMDRMHIISDATLPLLVPQNPQDGPSYPVWRTATLLTPTLFNKIRMMALVCYLISHLIPKLTKQIFLTSQ